MEHCPRAKIASIENAQLIEQINHNRMRNHAAFSSANCML